MYFQEHISTAAFGTNKSNFSALSTNKSNFSAVTVFKLKIICDFFAMHYLLYPFLENVNEIYPNWQTFSAGSSSLQYAILLDIWYETFVFKNLFLSKDRTTFSHLQPRFLKTTDFSSFLRKRLTKDRQRKFFFYSYTTVRKALQSS